MCDRPTAKNRPREIDLWDYQHTAPQTFPKPAKKHSNSRTLPSSTVVPGTSYANKVQDKTSQLETTTTTLKILGQNESPGLNDLLKLIAGPKLDKTLLIIQTAMTKISNTTALIEIIKILLYAKTELSK
ncbi:hypothetical protein CBL_05138 [Carabus blaptoides fortunei]